MLLSLLLSKVLKLVRWASSVPFSPSVPAEAGCFKFAVAAGVHVFPGWCK